MKYQYHTDGSPAANNQIFVFGSNRSGIHGAGAAKAAVMVYGATPGVGEGLSGRSYAIPTVRHRIAGPLPLSQIQVCVNKFIAFAEANPQHSFFVTRIGCMLAGYNDFQIAPMFKGAPINCDMPEVWHTFLED